MRALTVQQPFASAIVATGPTAKRCENRTWHRWWKNEWIAIHAGAAPYKYDRDYFGRGVDGWVAFLDDLERRTGWKVYGGDHPSVGFRGAILGVARFVDCVQASRRPGDPWAVGPWCHVISEARPLPAPILGVKGALGLWNVPDEHLPVLARLAA
jgi:hypothetical protein